MALHEWTVAGGLIETDAGVLLVRNVRRGGFEDWSTPGGVIDADDADLLAGLTREVDEETGLVVQRVARPALRGARVRPRHGLAHALRGAPRGRRSRASCASTTPTASSWRRASSRRPSATSTSRRARPGCASRFGEWLRERWEPRRGARLPLRGERHDPRLDARGAQCRNLTPDARPTPRSCTSISTRSSRRSSSSTTRRCAAGRSSSAGSAAGAWSSAASYEARAFGVHSAMPMGRARAGVPARRRSSRPASSGTPRRAAR